MMIAVIMNQNGDNNGEMKNERPCGLPYLIDYKDEPSRTRTCDPLVKSLKKVVPLSLAECVRVSVSYSYAFCYNG